MNDANIIEMSALVDCMGPPLYDCLMNSINKEIKKSIPRGGIDYAVLSAAIGMCLAKTSYGVFYNISETFKNKTGHEIDLESVRKNLVLMINDQFGENYIHERIN